MSYQDDSHVVEVPLTPPFQRYIDCLDKATRDKTVGYRCFDAIGICRLQNVIIQTLFLRMWRHLALFCIFFWFRKCNFLTCRVPLNNSANICHLHNVLYMSAPPLFFLRRYDQTRCCYSMTLMKFAKVMVCFRANCFFLF